MMADDINFFPFFFAFSQPKVLTDILEISNLIFSALFALEMVLKLIAFGFIGYVSNGFNVFDGFIVTLR